MGRRVTRETAFEDIQALLARNDAATAEKLMEKYGLPEEQRRALARVWKDQARRRDREARLAVWQRRFRRLRPSWTAWMALCLGALGYLGLGTALLRLWGPAERGFFPFLLHCVPPFLYAYIPVLLVHAGGYARDRYLWANPRQEAVEVAEIQNHTVDCRNWRRPDLPRTRAVTVALLRPVVPNRDWTERKIVLTGCRLHPGDQALLYYGREGRSSLDPHDRRTLRKKWRSSLLRWTAWMCLLPLILALASCWK